MKKIIRFLIKIFGDKVIKNGDLHYQKPELGFRSQIFNKLMRWSFNINHLDIEGVFLYNFKEALQIAKEDFEKENHAFVINIRSNFYDNIQIVHPLMNCDKFLRPKDFGFSIYFTFDKSDKGVQPYLNKFLQSNIEEIEHFMNDKYTACYDLNCGNDIDLVFENVKGYYQEILGYSIYKKYYIDLSTHGPIEDYLDVKVYGNNSEN